MNLYATQERVVMKSGKQTTKTVRLEVLMMKFLVMVPHHCVV